MTITFSEESRGLGLSESRYEEEATTDGYCVLQKRDDDIWNLQRLDEPGPELITAQGSDDSAQDAKQGSRNERLLRPGADRRARKGAEDNTTHEWPWCPPARRLGQFIAGYAEADIPDLVKDYRRQQKHSPAVAVKPQEPEIRVRFVISEARPEKRQQP